MQVENNLNLPQPVDVNSIPAGKGFSYSGLIHGVRVSGGVSSNNPTTAIRFSDLEPVAFAAGTQVYACEIKVVANPPAA